MSSYLKHFFIKLSFKKCTQHGRPLVKEFARIHWYLNFRNKRKESHQIFLDELHKKLFTITVRRLDNNFMLVVKKICRTCTND